MAGLGADDPLEKLKENVNWEVLIEGTISSQLLIKVNIANVYIVLAINYL